MSMIARSTRLTAARPVRAGRPAVRSVKAMAFKVTLKTVSGRADGGREAP